MGEVRKKRSGCPMEIVRISGPLGMALVEWPEKRKISVLGVKKG